MGKLCEHHVAGDTEQLEQKSDNKTKEIDSRMRTDRSADPITFHGQIFLLLRRRRLYVVTLRMQLHPNINQSRLLSRQHYKGRF